MLSRFSVKKPYTVLVGVLLMIVLGVVALTRMTTDLLPDMDLQYALIITTDMGASPEKVEMEVTAPIEAAIATTTGIKNVGSMSYNSYSVVTCEYEQNVNMDSVVIEIQQNLDQLSGAWGDHVGSPMIMKINPDMLPVMTAAVDVEGMTALEITDYVSAELIPAFESLEGVASASASGMLEETVVVTLDSEKIAEINRMVQDEIGGEFTEPQSEIDKAMAEIEKGKDAMSSGGNALSNAFDEIMKGKEELLKTEAELTKQYEELVKNRDELQALANIIFPILELRAESMKALEEAEKSLPNQEAELQALEKEIADLMLQIPLDQEKLDDANARYTAAKTAYETTKFIVEQGPKAWENFDAQLISYASQLNETGMMEIKTAEDIEKIKPALEEGLKQMNGGIAQMEEAMETIRTKKDELQSAIDTINSEAAKAAIEMGPAAAELSKASVSLEQAKAALEEAKEAALNSADMTGILTVDTLSGILMAQNFDMPAGYAYEDDTQYLIRIGEAVQSVAELENLVLMDLGMESVNLIHLKDVANIEVFDNSDETYAIVNGNPGITLSFEKQTGYSTGEVTDRLIEKFESLEAGNEDLNITVLMDQGIFIDLIVNSVVQNMIVGAILAVLVLILFLKDYRQLLGFSG